MKEFINIVFASDNNYAQHTAVAMVSTLINCRCPEQIKFYLIDDNIESINKDKIKKTVENLKGNIEFVKIKNTTLENCYVSGELSRASYFRLDIANILNKDVKKIIYLDSDLLVYDDIMNMWNIDMDGRPIAATNDLGIMASNRIRKQKNKFIDLPLNTPYFNAGVLMMDLNLWREKDIARDIIELAANNKYPNHDQDALNKYFMGNWKKLPLRWNVIPPVFNLFFKILINEKMRKEAIKAKLNTAIFHYAGGYKPWEYKEYKGFNDKYYKYLLLTEFRDSVMPQFDGRRKNRSIQRQLLRLKLGDFWSRIFGKE